MARFRLSILPRFFEWLIEGICAGALAATKEIVCGAEVNQPAMARDLALLGGVTMAEAVSFQLAQKLGKSEAHRIVESASQRALRDGTTMQEALAREPALAPYFHSEDFEAMLNPGGYLGASDHFIEQVLANHAARSTEVPRATR